MINGYNQNNQNIIPITNCFHQEARCSNSLPCWWWLIYPEYNTIFLWSFKLNLPGLFLRPTTNRYPSTCFNFIIPNTFTCIRSLSQTFECLFASEDPISYFSLFRPFHQSCFPWILINSRLMSSWTNEIATSYRIYC